MEDSMMDAMERGGREKRVLIVDDNIDAAMMMKLLLEYEGYAVLTAHDGKEALKLADEFSPTAALLDLTLPDMPGEDVAVELRKREAFSGGLIVAISGYNGDGIPAGFNDRLVKPVDHDKL